MVLLSWKWQVRDRSGLARLDYTQNAINKTLPTDSPGAPVSMPSVDWDELGEPEPRPGRYTIRSVITRLAEKCDLFTGLLRHHQSLPMLH